MPGGRIPPDGRPAQAKGVGQNSKRHDMERPATPGLHDSDLQQGDVQAMEDGQRIAPRTTQQPAAPPPVSGQSPRSQPSGNAASVPDAIQFMGQRSRGSVDLPSSLPARQGRLDTWMPLLRQLASAPGASGLLGSALINQVREARRVPRSDATVVDLQAIDHGVETLLREVN